MNETDAQPSAGPRFVPRAEHPISRANVSENALKVLYRLKNAGFAAYLVGGGVRDLMVGLRPKDFDVVTDAHPEEVRKLFRNCRLIGRRFRLAHVRFGRDVIEVATFRGATSAEEAERLQSDSGRILRDNVYGSLEEDIWRRDFTVNALYYNIADFSIVDYTSGIEDIRTRTLRLIGDPELRYREDPVRMLRAVRLAAKLGFSIAPESEQPLRELGDLLGEVPPARRYDELLKIFHGGRAADTLRMLIHYRLLGWLFPATARLLETPAGPDVLRFVEAGLRNTDERIAADRPVTPMFLFGVMLWPAIRERAETLQAEGAGGAEALLVACDEIVFEQQRFASFPRRFSAPMKEMLMMQRRFERRTGNAAARFLQHKRFRAAYDFLLLRARCGEADAELADWWTRIQELPPDEQSKALEVKRRRSPRRRRRGGRRARRAQPSDAAG